MKIISPRNRVNLRRLSSWLVLLISLVFTASSQANQLETKHQTASTFRWIHPNSDPQLWQQIESAFQDELAPDNAESGQDNLDVYRYKYVQKVGILGDSALVITRSNRMAALEGETKSSPRQFLQDRSFMDYISFLPRPRIRWEIS